MNKVELKTARLTILMNPAKKNAFETLCVRQDMNAFTGGAMADSQLFGQPQYALVAKW